MAKIDRQLLAAALDLVQKQGKLIAILSSQLQAAQSELSCTLQRSYHLIRN